jgi:hypothetical protein
MKYRYSDIPTIKYEGIEFYAIFNEGAQIVGYSQSTRIIPDKVEIDSDRTLYLFDACTVISGTLLGGVLRGGEINGGIVAGGEINGGNIVGGQFINGIWNSGVLINGVIRGGEFNGPTIYNGEFWGGTFNKVTIYDGVWNGGIYDETPLQIQTKEMFCFIQFPHGTTPYVLSMGCEAAFLDEFDVLDIKNRHGFSDEMYNEYVLYEKVYKQKYQA